MLLQNLKKTNQSQILKVQDVSFSIYEPKENGLKSIAFKICNDLLQCTTLRCLIKGGGQNKPGGGGSEIFVIFNKRGVGISKNPC